MGVYSRKRLLVGAIVLLMTAVYCGWFAGDKSPVLLWLLFAEPQEVHIKLLNIIPYSQVEATSSMHDVDALSAEQQHKATSQDQCASATLQVDQIVS